MSKIFLGQRTKISPEVAEKLAKALGVSRQWLLTGVDGAVSQDSPFEVKAIISRVPERTIKVASWAQAGEATDYEEIALEWQEEITTKCPDESAVAVQLRGDSMLPVYNEGDVVIMMPGHRPFSGCLVVAKLRDEGVTFKIYNEPTIGIIRLSAYNPAFLPLERRRDDFEWICPVYEMRRPLWR